LAAELTLPDRISASGFRYPSRLGHRAKGAKAIKSQAALCEQRIKHGL
jgi:hypothetical protein